MASRCALHARVSSPPSGWARYRWVGAGLSWLLNTVASCAATTAKPNAAKAFADLGCVLLCYRRWAKTTN